MPDPAVYPGLSLAQVADCLGLCYETVARKARSGEIRAFRVANRLRVRQVDLDAYVAGCELDAAVSETPPVRRSRPAELGSVRRGGRLPAAGSLAALEAIEREAAG